MKLANYHPAGNEILMELKEFSTSAAGVLLVKPNQEKIMKILKVGPTVTIHNPLTGAVAKPGDYCLPMSPNMMQFKFEMPDGTEIQAVQTKEFGIAAFYLPSDDETKFHTVLTEDNKTYESTRTMNVIDNIGIDKSLYLKEEAENKQKLDQLHLS